MKKLFNLKNNTQKGFTLLEMIVALAIFTIVAVVAVGALIKVMDANRKSINLKNTINNLNFVLESMSREMRVGTKFYCEYGNNNINHGQSKNGRECTVIPNDTSVWTVAFTSSKKVGNCYPMIAYRFENSKLKKAEQATNGNCPTDNATTVISSNDFFDLTSDSVNFTKSTVTIRNSPHPYATFFFSGSTGTKQKDKVDFTLQTSVTQRLSP